MSKQKETVNIKWHPAFYSATEFDFRKEKELLEFHSEYQLSKEPLSMDMLIIEKQANVELSNEIGKIFRKYNIVEYKSPDDNLSIDDFYKTIGYAALFKGTAQTVDMYPATEISVSLFRETAPVKLFHQLKDLGISLEERFPGIYYILGNTLFPVQIVITKNLISTSHSALKLLSKDVNPNDIRLFLAETEDAVNEDQNIDSILQVSVKANEKIYETIRRDNPMCEALRKLMQDDLKEERAQGRLEGKLTTLFELVKSNVLSIKDAAKNANLTEAEFTEKLLAADLK